MLRQVEIREPEQHRKYGKHDELWLWGFCEDVRDMLRQVEIREPEQHRKYGKHDELGLWGFCEDVEIC